MCKYECKINHQMPLPTVADKHHPGRSCGPCELCGAESYRYTHPEDWEDHEKEVLAKLSGMSFNRLVDTYNFIIHYIYRILKNNIMIQSAYPRRQKRLGIWLRWLTVHKKIPSPLRVGLTVLTLITTQILVNSHIV
jgi:hypothetical protein